MLRQYRNKISGAVVLVKSEVISEEWEEILAPLSSDSDKAEKKTNVTDSTEKAKRKTASKKKTK